MERRSLLLPLALVFVFGFLDLSVPLASGQTTHVLNGTVLDQDGNPVDGAVVEIYQWGQYDEVEAYGEGKDPDAPASDSHDSGSSDASEPARMPPHYENGYQRAVTDADGRFTVSLAEGYAEFNIYKAGHAHLWETLDITIGQDVQFELVRFPEKTAHIEGRIVDATNGQGLRWGSISVENPEFGTYECSIFEGDVGHGSDGEARPMVAIDEPASPDAETSIVAPDYWDPGCTITVNEDGTFSGAVTPGYSLIRVYYQQWRACPEGQYDGAACGPEYFALSLVRDLPADETTQLRLALTPRPGPDAVLSGYVVDGETRTAIPGVHISFANQDNYGWASAETDEDGSYRVRLRGGYLHVYVWAEGYLPYEGTIQIPSGQETPLDIVMTPGQARYGGGCCYAIAEDGMERSLAAGPAMAGADGDESAGGSSASSGFQDLGGGLGPYNANERRNAQAEEVQDTAIIALVLIGGAIAASAYVVRRK